MESVNERTVGVSSGRPLMVARRRAIGLAMVAVGLLDRASSVAAVALFEPLVAAVVVAEALPEARDVPVDQADSADPLRALPEVPSRDDEAGRPAVLGRGRLAVVRPGDGSVAVGD